MPISTGARVRGGWGSQKTVHSSSWIAGLQTTGLGRSETRITDFLKTAIFFCFFQLLALSAETKFDMAKWCFMVDALYLYKWMSGMAW